MSFQAEADIDLKNQNDMSYTTVSHSSTTFTTTATTAAITTTTANIFINADDHDYFWTMANQHFTNNDFDSEQHFCIANFAKNDCLHCGYAYTMQMLNPCEEFVGPLEEDCCTLVCPPKVIYDNLTVDLTSPQPVCVESLLAAILAPLCFVLGRGS